MKKVFFIFLSCVGVFLFFHFSGAEPAPSSVVITEVGTYESAQHEWIEIYNPGHEEVDLANWIFWEDGVNHQLTLTYGTSSLLRANQFAVIAQNADNFLLDYPLVTSTVFDSSWGSLNESGEEIGLKNAVGEFVEKFVYIPARDFSLERRGPTVFDYTENNWLEHENGNTVGLPNSMWTEEGSQVNVEEVKGEVVEEDSESAPGIEEDENTDEEENSEQKTQNESEVVDVVEQEESVSASTTEQQIFNVAISELLPYPVEGKEWVELFNDSSSTVELTAWSLFDGLGQIAAVSSTIEARGFLLVELSSAKLNNSGDTVVLKDPTGKIMDQVVYGDWGNDAVGNVAAPKQGVSLARNNDKFFQTTTVTPNAVNIVTEPALSESSHNRSNSAAKSETQPMPSGMRYPVSTVVVNELVSTPANGKEEWVELYNNTTEWLDLGGWSLEDSAGTRTNISGALPPQGFFVIEQPRGKLNNSGDKVLLYDPSDAVIDEVAYGSWGNNSKENSPPPQEQQALARVVDGKDTNMGKDFIVTQTPTKGAPNVINIFEAPPAKKEPAQTNSSIHKDVKQEAPPAAQENNISKIQSIKGLFISEVFPDPVGVDSGEFIELGNTGTTTVDLGGLLLDDAEGGSRPFRIPDGLIVAPEEFLVFEKIQTRLTLNNTSDSVRVLSPTGTVILEVLYDDAQEEASYIQDSTTGEWIWTTEVTPGAENVATVLEEEDDPSTSKKKSGAVISTTINQAHELDLGTRVTITGIVSAEPGVFGSQYFYLADSASSSEAGIQIYMYRKGFPSLEVGDVVQVTGEVSEASGQRRIKIKTQQDIVVAGRKETLQPQVLEVGEVGEEMVGSLVAVYGEITEKKSRYVYLDDGTDEIQVYVKAGVAADFSQWDVGDSLHIVGIVIKTKSGYQILPRAQDDIQEGVSDRASTSAFFVPSTSSENISNTGSSYLVATVGGGASVLLGIFGKLRGAAAWRWGRKVVSVAVSSVRKRG